MKPILVAAIWCCVAYVHAFTVLNSLDGFTSFYCGTSQQAYFLLGNGMKDIAIQFDLHQFEAPVEKAVFQLRPRSCFNSDKMFVELKTSNDEISFSPCKTYNYTTLSWIRLDDETCSRDVDVTRVFNQALQGNKKLQLFLVDRWISECDSIRPGTQSAPSCQVDFYGATFSSATIPKGFYIDVTSTTVTAIATTSTVSNITSTTPISETLPIVHASPATQTSGPQSRQNNSVQNNGRIELVSLGVLIVSTLVFV